VARPRRGRSLVLRRLIRANPTAAFIVIAFAFSYTVGIATILLVGWLARGSDLAEQYVGRGGVVFGPAVAAIVVTACTTGRTGVTRLLSMLKPHREDASWFLLLPFLALAIAVVAYLVTSTPVNALAGAIVDHWRLLLVNYGLALLITGTGEELGWRGWLLPRLLEGRSRARATLLVASVWCPWHLPILLRGGWGAIAFTAIVVAMSFLFTALWTSARQSVLVVAAAHASINAPYVFFQSTVGAQRSYPAWLAGCAVYSTVAIAVVALTWPWWRTEQRAPLREPSR
jgi:membrane protease YdiL (CAAX protease family)